MLTVFYSVQLDLCFMHKTIQQSEMQSGKDHDGFRVVFVMLKVSRQSKLILHDFMTSKQQICGADEQQ